MLRIPLVLATLCFGLSLAGCGGQDLPPDTAARPNMPMFVDPVANLKPQDDAIVDSFFIISNLRAGDREFGVLIHYIKTPGGVAPVVAISDAATGGYYLDENSDGKVSARGDGFEVNADNMTWTGTAKEMRVQAHLPSGESFDLTARPSGPVLAYNGTGYFPLADNTMPTWEYAFPTMATTGTVTVGGKSYEVSGDSWFDRQWFMPMNPKYPAAMATGKVSWTWIATRLPNGDVLAVWDMVADRERAWANIMRPDGTLIVADVEPLSKGMSDLWTSPKSKLDWPSQWTVVIPGTDTKLLVTATADGQEAFRYNARIEALARISGVHEGQPVSSMGYVEMVNHPAHLPRR